MICEVKDKSKNQKSLMDKRVRNLVEMFCVMIFIIRIDK